MVVPTPMQETKGRVKKKNKLVRLLRLSVLAGMLAHPFGAQLASRMTGGGSRLWGRVVQRGDQHRHGQRPTSDDHRA